jgi:CDP-glycerol glycerophosphotransferase
MSIDIKRTGPGRIPGLRRLPAIARPLKSDVVLFDSWHGRYSDNPRGISEELLRRNAPFRQVWVGSNPAQFPADVTIVKPASWRYFAYLAQARYIVASNELPRYARKSRHSIYVQTWHGTPLKRIAFDVKKPVSKGSMGHFKSLQREVSRWDFLISQNSFSTRILRQAFHYQGRILETGYPRNDLLSAQAAEKVRLRMRRELGIDADTCAVLYAPTWRDGSTFSLELDLAGMANALGKNYIILLRNHYVDAKTVALRDHPQVRNVSAYDDICELYLAADVLITDYSSVMFDFAVTHKPILFFTYDIEHYRDELRGFYFDLEEQAPGPLLRSTVEVIAALSNLNAVSTRYVDAYDRFISNFCPLDDGSASARIVDAVFAAG